ncbi:cyclase family protein [Alkalihalobacillus oceani]|uniref:cyclase family protein n=1 Tax=Halalkalibacter oceani TaxID=1653776 RepID=UPI00203DB447|nr:cyclase family protein [Halalkalibacter oceani]MCM3759946.1 cyclase family protein [Halalkalibacter oceani]
MKMVDLSMTVKDHWRWNINHELTGDFKEGDDFRSSRLQTSAHAFTHVDTPLHCKEKAVTIEKLNVDAYSGEAVVIDLSAKQADEAITVADLENNGKLHDNEKIILLKTCWDEKYSPYSREYWSKAPYVTEEAAIWLKERNPEVVGFDFPQDYPMKLIDGTGKFGLKDMPTHDLLLKEGILLVEYLCGMSQLTSSRVQFICLPIKLMGFEGAPARAIVIENN